MPSGYEKSPDYGGQPPIDPRRVAWVAIWALAVALFVCWVKFG